MSKGEPVHLVVGTLPPGHDWQHDAPDGVIDGPYGGVPTYTWRCANCGAMPRETIFGNFKRRNGVIVVEKEACLP